MRRDCFKGLARNVAINPLVCVNQHLQSVLYGVGQGLLLFGRQLVKYGGLLLLQKLRHLLKTDTVYIQIIADNLTVHSDINHVERMDAVPVIHIDTVVDVFQHKDHTIRQFIRGRHHSMKSTRFFVHVSVPFYVVQ